MGWIFFLYPRAAAVITASLFAFVGALLLMPWWPVVGAVVAIAVAVLGLVLAVPVARSEARRMGGTGHEGSGIFQSRDTPEKG